MGCTLSVKLTNTNSRVVIGAIDAGAHEPKQMIVAYIDDLHLVAGKDGVRLAKMDQVAQTTVDSTLDR